MRSRIERVPVPVTPHWKHLLLVALAAGCVCMAAAGAAANEADAQQTVPAWRVGSASAVITPDTSTWMAGYAARDKPSQGTEQELFAKALAIEDARGTRLVIVTTDLIGIPRELRDRVEAACRERFDLPPASLVMNASHTHCGPELRPERLRLYGLDASLVSRSVEYVGRLEGQLVELIGHALDAGQAAALSYAHARAGFAMNRRTPRNGRIDNHPNPEGPVDHDVPVLKVSGPDGALRSVLFGYACHNTTMGFYQFFGDYAGCAQEYLEEAHPGLTALFLAGCGGDQNPYPRRRLELARHHGRALANGVEAALETDDRPVAGPLAVAYDTVVLDFASAPTRDELIELQQNGNRFDRGRAEILLEQLASGGSISTEYSYPIHVAQFGKDLTLVSLAGEVVVDYSHRLKQELAGPAVWIAAYSNDVFGYVPSRRVLEEGGYEGGGAMRYTLLPGPFAATVEERIVGKVREMVQDVRQQVQSADPR